MKIKIHLHYIAKALDNDIIQVNKSSSDIVMKSE